MLRRLLGQAKQTRFHVHVCCSSCHLAGPLRRCSSIVGRICATSWQTYRGGRLHPVARPDRRFEMSTDRSSWSGAPPRSSGMSFWGESAGYGGSFLSTASADVECGLKVVLVGSAPRGPFSIHGFAHDSVRIATFLGHNQVTHYGSVCPLVPISA